MIAFLVDCFQRAMKILLDCSSKSIIYMVSIKYCVFNAVYAPSDYKMTGQSLEYILIEIFEKNKIL